MIPEQSAMDTFLVEIDVLVREGATFMEAVILWCERRGLEPEYAGALVKKNRVLRARIQEEAEALRCIKPRTRRLPV